MTPAEIEELRGLLSEEVSRYASAPPYITDEFVVIDLDQAHRLVSEAEILVIGIQRDLIPALQVAHMAYEELIDIIVPSRFEDRVAELLKRARGIVPPARVFGHDVPFETEIDELQWFQWFAATFFDLPFRDAAAIHTKHRLNENSVVIYRDEE